ncbi:MAG: hypothetical protein JW719_10480 [Pirellulales bacterium]|nr:hypothetical protein [Pirellulales bacterium]
MNNTPLAERPPFQFGLRAILIATGVLAVFLSVLKAIGCPTFLMVVIVIMLAVDLVVIAVLLVADKAWRKHKGRDNGMKPSDVP